MNIIDTHAHLYLDEFDADRDAMVQRAAMAGVKAVVLPNIDCSSIEPLYNLFQKNTALFLPMLGLHPTSVKQDYDMELNIIKQNLDKKPVSGIGEIGIDLYWDKNFYNQQVIAFTEQLNWAVERNLPVSIHVRNAHSEVFEILSKQKKLPKGIFHCFSGNTEQALLAIKYGFLIGIGGVISFKNSGLEKVVQQVDIKKMVVETDAPFLAPVPFRGKRNEPAFLLQILEKIAAIKNISVEQAAKETTENACELFSITI